MHTCHSIRSGVDAVSAAQLAGPFASTFQDTRSGYERQSSCSCLQHRRAIKLAPFPHSSIAFPRTTTELAALSLHGKATQYLAK